MNVCVCVVWEHTKFWNIYSLVGWSVVWGLWHINLCRLFIVKSIFIQIISSISNNSV